MWDQMKYQKDEAFRERKKARVLAYKKKFVAENGFWPSKLYQ